jgi:aspartate carbamoyltransferase regulatory subunit
MFLKQLYIHVLINVPRLLIEKDVVDINNEILTSITINRLMVLKPDVC